MKSSHRISLSEWFGKHTIRPLLWVFGFLIVVCLVFAAALVRNDREFRASAINDFLQVAPRAIAQANRPMLESLLISFAARVKASNAGICNGQRSLISLTTANSLCMPGKLVPPPFSRLYRFNLPGSENVEVYFVSPIFARLSELMVLFAVVVILVLVNGMILTNVKRGLWKDLIKPLESFDAEDVGISDLYELLKSKEEMQSLRTQFAVSEAKRKLSTQVAHDIRSPLSALNILVKRARGLRENEQQMLETIADRIRLIADELLFSERNELPTSVCPFNLGDALHQVISEKKIQCPEEVVLHYNFPGELANISVIGEREKFMRIISNLLNNSIEAIDGVGSIDILCKRKASYIQISLCDTGKGIDPKILKRIGTVKVTDKSEGNGIGLSSAFSMAEAWSASIEINSIEGSGTQVFFNLKIADHVSAAV